MGAGFTASWSLSDAFTRNSDALTARERSGVANR